MALKSTQAKIIGALLLSDDPRDRDDARRRIREAIDASEGVVSHAADALGVSYRALTRWCEDLGLRAYAADLRVSHGKPDRRPEG